MAAVKRIRELDGFRGIAALCVLLYHYTSRFSIKFDNNLIVEHFNFQYGNYGVELFFIISGFVIFMSVERVKTPFEFVFKRFIRLYPTFWICMILSFIFIQICGPTVLQVSDRDFIINFTMLPSVFDTPAVDGVYWTLKVEMCFYAFIVLVLMTNTVTKIQHMGFIYILLGFLLLIGYKVFFLYYYGLLFLIGINFYKIWKEESTYLNHLQIFLCFILSTTLGDLVISIVSLLLVFSFYLLVYGKLKFMAFKPLVFLGKISYALYLIHQNIGYSIQLKLINVGIHNFLLLLLIPTLIAIATATAITYFLEQPIITKLSVLYKKKENLFPGKNSDV